MNEFEKKKHFGFDFKLDSFHSTLFSIEGQFAFSDQVEPSHILEDEIRVDVVHSNSNTKPLSSSIAQGVKARGQEKGKLFHPHP